MTAPCWRCGGPEVAHVDSLGCPWCALCLAQSIRAQLNAAAMHQPINAEDPTRAELEEAIGHLNREAKRCPAVLGTDQHPSRWTLAHRKLDQWLTWWQINT